MLSPVTQTVQIALLLGCVGFSQPMPTLSGSTQASAQPRVHSAAVVSTPMEAALDALLARFPSQVVIGFEELWDTRPDSEPQPDLGPPDASLEQALERIGHLNPAYKSAKRRAKVAPRPRRWPTKRQRPTATTIH